MASSMNTKWKQMFVWSSIGGAVLGAAVTLARKKRRDVDRPLVCRKVPAGCEQFSVWTERFNLEEGGQRQFAHDRYFFEATPFKVWNVLDLADANKRLQDGAPVYHVTHIRNFEKWQNGSWQEQEQVIDRYYGTIAAIGNDGKPCGRNMIARSGILEIRRCLVGGASNGVETGEKHRSEGKILNYRWDAGSSPEAIRG
jgi:hypothetical protein